MSRTLSIKQPLRLFQPLKLANRHIATLINALWLKQLDQRLHDPLPAVIHPKSQDLHHVHLFKLIHNKPWQKVRFSINEAIGVRIRQKTPPYLGTASKPFLEKG